ncbi:MAG: hypothetical protein U9N87_04925, partial [Planctomycetota bacterium]|nr:hypothetical protein [Planctomycetota bacterium]
MIRSCGTSLSIAKGVEDMALEPSNLALRCAQGRATPAIFRQILVSTFFAVAICAASLQPSWAAEKQQKTQTPTKTLQTLVLFDGKPITPLHGSISGFWMYAEKSAPQLALMGHLQKTPHRIVVALDKGQRATLRIPLPSGKSKTWFSLRAKKLDGSPAVIALGDGGKSKTSADVGDGKSLAVTFDTDPTKPFVLSIDVSAPHGATAARLDHFDLKQDGRAAAFHISPLRRAYPEKGSVACSPAMHGTIEQALIEWDWRLQDGIDTPLEP